jgi:uncharacterized protein YciI
LHHYLFKLVPPRATFPADITPAEMGLMQEHSAYWTEQMRKGYVVAIGPVADPAGTYGIGIIQMAAEEDPEALCANDPVLLANVGFTAQVHPMPRLMVPEQA